MKNLFLVLGILLLSFAAYTPSPAANEFPGVARDIRGNAVVNKSISIRLSILNSSTSRVAEYSETRTVKTNSVGLFNVVIGSSGARGIIGSVGGVNWSSGSKYLWLELDPQGGSSFIDMGITQLQSVPYAIRAANVTGVVSIINGGTGATTSQEARTNLGLGNIDNTSDLNKPISTATQAALDERLKISDTAAMLSNYAKLYEANAGINLKVNISDTAAMLSTYARTQRMLDSLTLVQNRISLKLNIADTAAMLSPYATVASTTAGINTKVNITDTAAMLSTYARTQRMLDSLTLVQNRINLKLNIADTAAMLSTYATVAKYYRRNKYKSKYC